MMFGGLCLAVGGLIVAYPDYLPVASVSAAAIESDPEGAAAQARRTNQLRGGIVAIVGFFLLFGGFASMF